MCYNESVDCGKSLHLHIHCTSKFDFPFCCHFVYFTFSCLPLRTNDKPTLLIKQHCSSSSSFLFLVCAHSPMAGRWGSVGFNRGSTGLEHIYPDFPDRRDGIPASSKSPTARLLVHSGWHMTAARLMRARLSVDIPPPSFLCRGHELRTILRDCTQVHSQCGQVELLMRLAGIHCPWCGSWFYEDVPFQTVPSWERRQLYLEGSGYVCVWAICVWPFWMINKSGKWAPDSFLCWHVAVIAVRARSQLVRVGWCSAK